MKTSHALGVLCAIILIPLLILTPLPSPCTPPPPTPIVVAMRNDE